ncbi:type IV toxin-antitoxin system AbiEi family antitoxin domain-containing protein [Streptacidiphilus sp. MAP5-3]|uniref:type IV toxin-antitoxin system AbiEi family antitoxin domain-containing protein n=1 Tax=unclassified Streptacidiphilus TaxID=2643834 RepID=UPI003518DBCE
MVDSLRLEMRLSALPPTFTTTEAHGVGLASRDLATLLASGELDELSRGVYRLASAPESAHLDLLAVARRAPLAVVCGESALALHELIDDIPSAVHVAVPRGSHRPQIAYPPTVVSQYAAETFRVGVEPFEVAPGEAVSVYSAERSVVDAMRFRHRIGESLALSALGRFLRNGGPARVAELNRIAGELGALTVIRPSVEAVLA